MKQKKPVPKRQVNAQLVLAIVAGVIIIGGLVVLRHQNKVKLQGLSSKASEVTPHWPHAITPFSLTLLDSTSNSVWANHIKFNASSWEQSDVVSYRYSKGQPESNCNFYPELMNICSYSDANSAFIASAGFVYFKDHIITAAMAFNDAYFNSKATKLNPGSVYANAAWRNRFMCQWMGFNMGIGIRDWVEEENSTSCMESGSTFTQGPSQTQPDAQDLSTMKSLYDHEDSTSSTAMSSKTAQANKLLRANNYGKLVETSKDGHEQTYMQDLGNGYQMVTRAFKK
jgi:hypothetical protein